MKVDAAQSVYQERRNANRDFTRRELKRLRCLLRRLRFLEAQMRTHTEPNDGALFTEWEAEALEWILDEVGFLDSARVAPAASHR